MQADCCQAAKENKCNKSMPLWVILAASTAAKCANRQCVQPQRLHHSQRSKHNTRWSPARVQRLPRVHPNLPLTHQMQAPCCSQAASCLLQEYKAWGLRLSDSVDNNVTAPPSVREDEESMRKLCGWTSLLVCVHLTEA